MKRSNHLYSEVEDVCACGNIPEVLCVGEDVVHSCAMMGCNMTLEQQVHNLKSYPNIRNICL